MMTRTQHVLGLREARIKLAVNQLRDGGEPDLGDLVAGHLKQGITLLRMLHEAKQHARGTLATLYEEEQSQENDDIGQSLQWFVDAVVELEHQIQTNGQGVAF